MKYMCRTCNTGCNNITEHITKVHKFSLSAVKLDLEKTQTPTKMPLSISKLRELSQNIYDL